MVSCICVRGSTLAQFDTVLVLLFEGRTSCSTSYSSSFYLAINSSATSHASGGETSALRVIMATSGEPSTWFPLGELVKQKRLSPHISFFRFFRNFRSFGEHFGFLKKLQAHGTLPWHYHFLILLAPNEASIYNLNLLLH